MMQKLFCFILFLLVAFSAQAAVDVYNFDDEQQQSRYNLMIEELRCPKCQNQNLAGSDAPIAQDLRRELHRLILEGQDEKAIKAFMVARYGNFVLYRPPLDSNTVLLWSAPIILLFLGVVIALRVRRGALQTQAATTLSEAEQKRLDELLAQYAKRK